MAYHLLTYSLIFLPVVIALYQLCPARFRFVVLLAADYTFFCMISGKLLVWLLWNRQMAGGDSGSAQ